MAQALCTAAVCAGLLAVSRRRDLDRTLRLSSNPLKQSLYLLGSLVFVAVGILMLRDPKADTGTMVIAYLCIGLFGLGVVVFLFSLAREFLMRRPVLQVNSQDWTYNAALRPHPQYAPWQDIGRIAIFRQQLPHGRMFYLALEARNPDEVPHSRMRSITASFYPSMSQAVMTVPLNTVFVRTTPAKVKRLLRRIEASFSDELHSYGIAVDDEIHDM